MSLRQYQLRPIDTSLKSQLRPVMPGDKKQPGQVLWAIFIGGALDGCVKIFVNNDKGVQSLKQVASDSQALDIKYYYPPSR